MYISWNVYIETRSEKKRLPQMKPGEAVRWIEPLTGIRVSGNIDQQSMNLDPEAARIRTRPDFHQIDSGG